MEQLNLNPPEKKQTLGDSQWARRRQNDLNKLTYVRNEMALAAKELDARIKKYHIKAAKWKEEYGSLPEGFPEFPEDKPE